MKTDVEELSPTRVKPTIEVPFDELEHAFDETYKSLAKQVRIKGFRPGKAPARLIDRYVGRGAVISEAVNHAVPELYNEAIQKEELFALGQPDVEVTKLEDNDELAFTAEVDIRPKFEVSDHKGIEVTVDNAEVTDEQVDEQVGTLRERFSTLVGVDRPIEDGDHLSIDLSAAIDGAATPTRSAPTPCWRASTRPCAAWSRAPRPPSRPPSSGVSTRARRRTSPSPCTA